MGELTTNEKQATLDAAWLEVADAALGHYVTARNSLKDGMRASLVQHFIVYATEHVHRSVDGYVYLSRGQRHRAALLLVRPAIEVMFRIEAIVADNTIIDRIAFGEVDEEKKMVKGYPKELHAAALADLDRQWYEFKTLYEAIFPGKKVRKQPLNVKEAAGAAKQDGVYSAIYRLYCKHTHGSLRASIGGYNKIVPASETYAMVGCILSAIQALQTVGCTAPDMKAVESRIAVLSKITSQTP